MNLDLILFFGLSLVAVVTALGMLLNRNAIYCALLLVLNFVTVAVFYLLLGAPFIAMSQITVYAGAIMVLFLFVIMLLGAERLPDARVLPHQKLFGYGLALVLLRAVAQNIDSITHNLDGTTHNMNEFSRLIRQNPGLLLSGSNPEADKGLSPNSGEDSQ